MGYPSAVWQTHALLEPTTPSAHNHPPPPMQGDYAGAALRYAQGLRYLVWTTFKTLDRGGDLPGWTYDLQVGPGLVG